MDDRRVGRIFREVRVKRVWRQSDLAAAAGASQGTVSLIERGRLEDVALTKIRSVGAALEIAVALDAWWRTGNADRLPDRGHAALVEHAVAILRDHGWVTRIEATFNRFGDRGSADIIAARRGFGGIWFVDFDRIGADAAKARQIARVRPPRT